jgi:hypothetical protein
MSPFRKLLLVAVGAFALYGAQACSSDELNPQPLPPDDGRTPAGTNGTGGDKTDNPAQDGTTGAPPAAPDAGVSPDGGADAHEAYDAHDAGGDGG